MVEFTIEFSTSDSETPCKDVVEAIPEKLLEMLNIVRDRGVESEIWYVKTDEGIATTDIKIGSENAVVTEEPVGRKLDLIQEAEGYNVNTSDLHMIHTHTSNLAGLSMPDVLAALRSADSATPVTGNFVLAEFRGTVKINGIKLNRARSKNENVTQLANMVEDIMKDSMEGKTDAQIARSKVENLASEIYESCSYSTSKATIEELARGN